MVNLLNSTKTEFARTVSQEKIVCFGAGKELFRICKEYPQMIDNILFIADNKKYGTNIVIAEKEIEVISFDDERLINREFIGVISTVNYADQIVKQLDGNNIYDNKRIFFPYILIDKLNNKIIFNGEKSIIPKKIHYCWFGKSNMPTQFRRNIDTWKKYCPEYEIVRWDESNYDIEKNQYMKQAYESKKWGFVPDYARLDIVNQHGGIYLDTDVELLKNLDKLLGYDFFCGFENINYVALGLGFGGISDNIILQEMMECYDQMMFINNDGTLNLVASPVYQTEVLKRHGLVCNGEFQMINNSAVFPKVFFSPINIDGIGRPMPCSFSIHQYAATWFDESMHSLKNRKKEAVNYMYGRINGDCQFF